MNLTTISTLASTLTSSGTALSNGASGNAATMNGLTASAAKMLSSQNVGLKALDARIDRDHARLSGIGKMALALDGFRSTAGALAKSGLGVAASASGAAVTARLSATGTAAAGAGTHAVEVQQLAQAQQLATRALPGNGAALGTGAATVIQVATGSGKDARTTTVKIDASNNTLDGIAKAMKEAGLDAGVTRSGNGYALTLKGQTGAANAMRIGVTGDAVLKGLLTYPPVAGGAMVQTAAAQDAQLTVDGKAVTSASNKLDSAVPGVALTLAATGKSTVTVGADASAIASNVKGFVDAYNTLNANLAALKSSSPDSASMIGDVRSQLAVILGGTDAGTLAQAGITQKNGNLVLDEARLKTAIAAQPDQVAQVFSNKGDGLADRMAARVMQQMADGGLLDKQASGLQQDVTKLAGQRTKAADAINRQAAQLAQQYATVGTSASGNWLFGTASAGGTSSVFDYTT